MLILNKQNEFGSNKDQIIQIKKLYFFFYTMPTHR